MNNSYIKKTISRDIESDEIVSNIGYPFSEHNISTYKHKNSYLSNTSKDNLSLIICGPAGVGVKTIENLLLKIFKQLNFEVFSASEYMSRVRGGSNSTYIEFGSSQIASQTWYADIVIALEENSLEHIKERINTHTTVITDIENCENLDYINIQAKQEAQKLGSKEYANTIIAGLIIGILKFNADQFIDTIEQKFKDHSPEDNIKAFKLGFELSKNITMKLSNSPQAASTKKDKYLLNGTTACGFGFLAGGCNFTASYPMSPSTGVLNFMSKYSKDFTILVEQVEDEISALNMVLGAWYVGARALTTTSGGGFALMCETMSLSGVSETPAVIYLAQRPGPATGMPTRTEQGDLNLVIYSGHGEFARLILAPGDLQECIDLGYLSFELADRFQIPVVLLIDQYLAEVNTTIEVVDFSKYPQKRYIEKTISDYKRYTLTQEGISPRGIPSYGEGIVYTDCHEHDESGHMTESYKIRDKMIKKRKDKETSLKEIALKPSVYGKGSIALVGWGSTKGTIAQTIQNLQDERVYQIHYFWVYPLSKESLDPLKEVDTIILIENNSNAQFADQLKLNDIKVDYQILQSNGFSFFSDQLTQKVQTILKEI